LWQSQALQDAEALRKLAKLTGFEVLTPATMPTPVCFANICVCFRTRIRVNVADFGIFPLQPSQTAAGVAAAALLLLPLLPLLLVLLLQAALVQVAVALPTMSRP
jgi:hypothetical protein